ncbi:MAG: heavy-metal-associated domain-containing protein [Saprospiraceae bacterium]|nr:heavy-metal-associated domain-containing protein [Saprospiraceae bacterium]
MCSNAINKQLKSLTDVDSVVIDLNTNTFVVHLKKEAIISPRVLKEKVEKAGFFVGSMIVTMNFDNTDISENIKVEKEGIALVIIDSKSKVLLGETKAKIMDKGYVTQKIIKIDQITFENSFLPGWKWR